jgi:hypothetical protein
MPTDARAAAKKAAVQPGVILDGLSDLLAPGAEPKSRDAQVNQVQIKAELRVIHSQNPGLPCRKDMAKRQSRIVLRENIVGPLQKKPPGGRCRPNNTPIQTGPKFSPVK